MSKAQIFEELPELSPSDRSQLFSPSPSERRALDEALTAFERNRDPGGPWPDVFRKIRESRR